jgi:hypothetical protein
MIRALAIVLALSAVPLHAVAQTQPQPSEERMSRQDLRDEVARLRGIVQGRAVLPRRPPGCASAESRQFDFWLGEWDVSPTGSTSGVTVAESSITLADQGCVIIEHWRPFGGAHGHSINVFDASDSKWHQTWADATGRRTEYAGVLDAEGVLRFDNLGPEPERRRMSFQRLDENAVRQWGERYDEASQAWVSEWDFTYRRRTGTR